MGRARMDDHIMHGRFSRRDFLRLSAASAAGVLLSSCTTGVRPPMGSGVEGLDTRWPIKRVVYLFMENRSFDHMFGRFPGARGTTVGDDLGRVRPLRRAYDWMAADIPHDRAAGLNSWNNGRMDNFGLGEFGWLFAYTQYRPEDIANYWHWAENYVLCDNFFASVNGPSHPNHLFYIAGTASGAIDNPENIRVRQEGDRYIKSWGIDAHGEGVFVLVMDEHGNVTKHTTRFDIPTVGEQLTERDIDWVNYAPEPHQAGYIWSTYSAIPSVFETELWDEHIWPVDEVLVDIEANALPSVSWIKPRFQVSDHPPFSTCHAMNWVTDIVNAIMRSDMWEHTAIFLTWDEWGGFYDHVEPPWDGVRQLGFRVPMLVISPYAKRGYVDDAVGEFTSPLKFIADNWGLPHLTDAIANTHNFEHVFDFDREPRSPDPLPRAAHCQGEPFEYIGHYDRWPPGIEGRSPGDIRS
jgi:phospholipase C